jgi:SsrA-binding protein
MAKSKGEKSKSGGDDGPVIDNRKARHDYAILDTLECGMVLSGSEVKSIRDGKVSLGEGYVRVEGYGPKSSRPVKVTAAGGKKVVTRRPMKAGIYLHGVNIAEYAPAGRAGSNGQHWPTRTRELLANKRELLRLGKEVEAKGMTLIPLKIYFKNGKAKLLVGVAKGKQAHDKRESIAKRDAQRDIARAMSKRM